MIQQFDCLFTIVGQGNHEGQGLPLYLEDGVRNGDVAIAAWPGGCSEDPDLVQRGAGYYPLWMITISPKRGVD